VSPAGWLMTRVYLATRYSTTPYAIRYMSATPCLAMLSR
jgi:hypothetical protein